MEHPILNPPNPYVGPLRVFPGTLIKVGGRAKLNAVRFAINLQTGPSLNPRDDLALHLSPSFTPPRIVRNTLQHGAWGLEEAWGNGTVLNPHQPFEIIILVEPDQFKIAINGAHFCEFRHRMPYPEISYLSIDGDVDIDHITVTSMQPSYPSATAPMPTPASYGATPYPTAGAPMMPMPMPTPTQPYYPSGPYPAASAHTPASDSGRGYPPPAGPMPTGATYSGGSSHSAGYPPTQPAPYMPGGPTPTGATYQSGYPNQPYHHPQNPQPGQSSTSTPFGNIPIGGKALGTIAGLGLGAAAGAAVLSAVNPLKHVKKIMKPKKMFKHKGWGKSSSSSNSSISSRSSFSSNSS